MSGEGEERECGECHKTVPLRKLLLNNPDVGEERGGGSEGGREEGGGGGREGGRDGGRKKEREGGRRRGNVESVTKLSLSGNFCSTTRMLVRKGEGEGVREGGREEGGERWREKEREGEKRECGVSQNCPSQETFAQQPRRW